MFSEIWRILSSFLKLWINTRKGKPPNVLVIWTKKVLVNACNLSVYFTFLAVWIGWTIFTGSAAENLLAAGD